MVANSSGSCKSACTEACTAPLGGLQEGQTRLAEAVKAQKDDRARTSEGALEEALTEARGKLEAWIVADEEATERAAGFGTDIAVGDPKQLLAAPTRISAKKKIVRYEAY